ncbi:exostosin domain-containing protein [Sessilibacter corallicola]|uniref:Exostosin GT47 domain-containing protein n=1 Tax=Sessilibacter corallicola TaxID=2904075 RepID=A0ABQ0A8A6_9GAMM
MINLFFPYYSCGNSERQNEIDLCLRENLLNQEINKIFLLVDDGSVPPIPLNERVEIISLESRPTYKIWVELSLEYCTDQYSILSNSDIYFDDRIASINRALTDNNTFLALTRWEKRADDLERHPNPHWSQDTWGFFVGKKFSDSHLKRLNFPMGVPRCDNKIAYIFATYGWKVSNPMNEITSIHVHESEMRTYDKKLDDRIMGGVAYVHPVENLGEESDLEIDIWMKRTSSVGKPVINKSMERWISEFEEAESDDKEKESLVQYISVEPKEYFEAIKKADCVKDFGDFFKALEYQGFYYFINPFEVDFYFKVQKLGGKISDALVCASALIPPVITSYQDSISDKPLNQEDVNFWQYPCATEKQAYENHLRLKKRTCIDLSNKVIEIYIAIPWATFIDKKKFDQELIKKYKFLIDKYNVISKYFGFPLRVHAVCQHIHWVRILPTASSLGITDLHISHKISSSEYENNCLNISIHGWPLIAVNYETPDRRKGLEIQAISNKKLLCSFVGAYMPHYRDKNRIHLRDLALSIKSDDVFIELGEEWHFNNHVYLEQVQNQKLATEFVNEDEQKTFNYNKVLSDSIFSLCPEGAGPNTLRFWEAISVGSIPVLFSADLSIFNDSRCGYELLSNCIVWEGEIDFKLIDYLRSISEADLSKKSSKLIELYQYYRVHCCF